MSLLKIQGIEKDFGGLIALSNVSFEVHEGEIVSVIGPNGAGKTTLFNCLTGYSQPDQGQVYFLGKDITGFEPHEVNAIGIARTFQQIRLFMNLTILENILIGMHSRTKAGVWHALLKPRWVRDEDVAARAKVLDILGLFQEPESDVILRRPLHLRSSPPVQVLRHGFAQPEDHDTSRW